VSRAATELPGEGAPAAEAAGFRLIRKVVYGAQGQSFLATRAGSEAAEKPFVFKCVFDAPAALLDQVRRTTRLSHPNLADVYKVGMAEGVLYLALEHVPGEDLATIGGQLRAAGRKLPVEVALKVGIEVCAGLTYAHTLAEPEKPIAHGAVWPSNIVVSRQGEVRLLEVGIASGASPEQDLTDLGTTLFVLLTGEHPLEAEGSRPRDARSLRDDLPASVAALLGKVLEPSADGRIGSAAELATALSAELTRLAPGTGPDLARFMAELDAPAAKAPAPPPSATGTGAGRWLTDLWAEGQTTQGVGLRAIRRRMRRGRPLLALAALAAIGGMVFLTTLMLRQDAPETDPPPPPAAVAPETPGPQPTGAPGSPPPGVPGSRPTGAPGSPAAGAPETPPVGALETPPAGPSARAPETAPPAPPGAVAQPQPPTDPAAAAEPDPAAADPEPLADPAAAEPEPSPDDAPTRRGAAGRARARLFEPRALQAVVRKAQRKFAGCLYRHGDSPTKPRDKLTMYVRVTSNGRVKAADVNLVGVDDEALATCLEGQATRLRFPRHPEPEVRFSFPVVAARSRR
jgi:eukaryotic-like serine/threonine-protein kinase